jgi:hypothetical protein
VRAEARRAHNAPGARLKKLAASRKCGQQDTAEEECAGRVKVAWDGRAVEVDAAYEAGPKASG